MSVATVDGRVVSGLVKSDGEQGMVLVVSADQEERIGRAEIEEVRPGTTSVMPAGLDQQITPQELADLIAFLRACQ